MTCKKLTSILLGGMAFLSAYSQDFNGLDYLRKISVNREWVKRTNKIDDKYLPTYDNFKWPFKDEAKNYLEKEVMNIHFQTNKTNLTKHDSIDLLRYVQNVLEPYMEKRKIICFNVEGFADFRGDNISNYFLSVGRATSALSFFRRFFPASTRYLSVYGGELPKKFNDPLAWQKDRVAKIIPNENALGTALDFCKGDIYLLDQSGSMKSNDSWAWKFLRSCVFPDSVEVYSFSKLISPAGKIIKVQHSYNINTEKPIGITPFYLSLDTLISSVSGNKTITTLINGGDTYGEKNPEEVIDKAKKKNITLNIVGINLDPDQSVTLVKMARDTGGKYYFLRRFN